MATVTNKRSESKRKLLCGVGYNDKKGLINELIDGKRVKDHFCTIWSGMIQRCYSKKHQEKRPEYKGVTVCKEWHQFSNFKEWMKQQDWKGKELDKDILSPGNKVYSPENCIFVTSKINSLIKNNIKTRGKYPQGVSFSSRYNKFYAHCRVDGKSKHLGVFCTSNEASKKYKKFKGELIKKIADEQKDFRLRDGLLKHTKIFLGEQI